MRQDIAKMTVTTRNVSRVGAIPKLLVPTDEGSGSLIMASEITPRRDNEIDLHAWKVKSEYFKVCYGIVNQSNTHHTNEVTGHDKHDQKSMEGNSFGHIDASIHLSRFAEEASRYSLEAMKMEAETRLEAASRRAKITIVRNIVFPNTAGSWRRAIGNLTIRSEIASMVIYVILIARTAC